jgi:hypothetical protein
MSSEIIAYMKELKNIQGEIKRVNEHIKKVRERKSLIESRILAYLEKVDEPGIMYEDITVLRHQKTQRQKKPTAMKRDNVIQLLENNGVHNAERIYNEITETMKGEAESVPTLKIKEKKKDE